MYPILITIGPVTIYTLWLLIALGIILASYVFTKLALKNKLNLEFIVDKSLILLISTIISARLFFIFFNFSSYFYEFSFSSFLQIFYIWDKGLYFWPGFITGMIAFIFICQREKENFYKWMDIISIPTLIGLTFFYVGAFFEGIKYGKETSLPIGITFESATVQYNIPIHPTQLYSALVCLLLIFVLRYLFKINRASENEGFITNVGTLIFSLWYFIEGFLRGDDTIMLFNIRFPQIFSLIIFIASLIFLYIKFINKKEIKLFSFSKTEEKS